MINHLARNIELGPRQLSLFESQRDTLAEQERLRACAAAQIERQGQVDLCDFVFTAAGMLNWSEFKILQHLFWLVQDLEILFRIDNTNITAGQARKILSRSPAPEVKIALNRPVDETVLLKVKTLYHSVCSNTDDDAFYDQTELARLLASQIRKWKRSLESCRRYARRQGFPGKREIETGLALIKRISEKQDAFSLIHAFSENAEEIARLVKTIETLTGFYKNDRERWQRIVDFAHEAVNTLADSNENPAVVSAYMRFNQILSSAHPYGLVDEAGQLLKKLKVHHDKIVAHRTSRCRSKALSAVDALIQEMKACLQKHAASDDLRNQSLYPLRLKSKSIKAAPSISSINRHLHEAREIFEMLMDDVIDQQRQ